MNNQLSFHSSIKFLKYLIILSIFSHHGYSYATELDAGEKKHLEISKISYPDKPSFIGSEYIVSSGDVIFINFQGIDAYTGQYYVDPQGNLSLPDLGSYKVDGKTLKEIKKELLREYKDFIVEPGMKLKISSHRPVAVYLRGQVRSPGLYKINYEKIDIPSESTAFNKKELSSINTLDKNKKVRIELTPKLFDVLTLANGFTNKADLSEIQIIRNNSIEQGGGKISAKINFLSMLLSGDQSVNIRIFDGDTIVVPKSDDLLKEQILEIQRSNLMPEKIIVYITGNVRKGGKVTLKKGASLNHAIASTGGKKILTGNIEFIRFKYDGETKKSTFSYSPNAQIASKRNPILMDGDIINVRRTPVGAATEILGEISSPILSAYGLINIFN